MKPNENQLDLIRRLNENWPAHLKITLVDGQIADLKHHALGGELAALEAGRTVSLPFFVPKEGEVRWFTAGKCAENLRFAIEQLRCWVLPSFGWEEPVQPLVIPASATGQLGRLIVSIYPGGYFRWRTSIQSGCVQRVVGRLKAIRKLDTLKPEHVFDRIPSLFELRQQYAIALATGDRDSAMESIRIIDHHQLDSAVNTAFMLIRLWDQFREYSEIVENPRVREFIRIRIPRSIRMSILRAYHAVFLAESERAGEVELTIKLYEEKVHPDLAGLIRTLSPKDGLEAKRCLGYLAWYEGDEGVARQVMEEQHDPFLTNIFSREQFQKTAKKSVDTFESFHRARYFGNWEDLQQEGMNLLRVKPEALPAGLMRSFLPILLESLNHLPNQELQQALSVHSSTVDGLALKAPQNWTESFEAFSDRQWDKVRRFLNAEMRPSLTTLDLVDVCRSLSILEELLTDPQLIYESGGLEVVSDLLTTFIDDFVRQELFPQDGYADVYEKLLHIWVGHKMGSVRAPDGQLLLTLAHAVLSYRGDETGEIAGAIRLWWQARRVRALVPFLIEALELLVGYTDDRSLCENLWIELADLVRIDCNAYSPGEKDLLREIGRRMGLDTMTIHDFLGSKAEKNPVEDVDVLAITGLKKIAIVSLHEKAASSAAKMITERTKVPVVLVAEKDAGAQTKSAKTADVILFVWSASKHAVYRAFDDVRDKLAYVQGVGASSIVLALERWVVKGSIQN